jgi:hypothetical protein
MLEEPRSETGLPELYLCQLVHLSTTVVNAVEYINLAMANVTSRNDRKLMAALIVACRKTAPRPICYISTVGITTSLFIGFYHHAFPKE